MGDCGVVFQATRYNTTFFSSKDPSSHQNVLSYYYARRLVSGKGSFAACRFYFERVGSIPNLAHEMA